MPTSKKRVKKTKKTAGRALNSHTTVSGTALLTNAQRKKEFDQLELLPEIRDAIGEIDENDDWFPFFRCNYNENSQDWVTGELFYRPSVVLEQVTSLSGDEENGQATFEGVATIVLNEESVKSWMKVKTYLEELKSISMRVKLPAKNWVNLMKAAELKSQFTFYKALEMGEHGHDIDPHDVAERSVNAYLLHLFDAVVGGKALSKNAAFWHFLCEIEHRPDGGGSIKPTKVHFNFLRSALTRTCKEVFTPHVQAKQLTKALEEQSQETTQKTDKKAVLL